MRLAVLASGRGSNLRALVRAHDQGVLASSVAGVFSDRPLCAAIAFAATCGITTFSAKPSGFDSRELFDRALFDHVAAVQPDLIICAGYMRLISANAVARFEGRMINIHPSLLPDYPGLDTHARVLSAGGREHGASVHLVVPALDAGPVIAQARVPVLPADDSQLLAARVLGVEHPLLVGSLALLTAGRISLHEGQVLFDDRKIVSPLQLVEGQLAEAIV